MKVLWFTNTPSMAENKTGHKPIGGGWIKSLEKEISKSKRINLGIAFYSKNKVDDFNQTGTKYFPISRNLDSNKFLKIYKRAFSKNDEDKDIDKFLNIINNFKPDLIHILGTEGPFGLVQKYVKSIPVVISIQGNITVYTDKFHSGVPKYDVEKFSSFKTKILFKSYINLFERFKKLALRENEILSYTKYIIGRTDWDKRITRVLSPNSVYFHNDEILRDSFYKNIWENSKEGKVIIFSTTGAGLYKGIETILKTANHLDTLKINYKWELAGISSSDQVVNLAVKSHNINISKNIIFLGEITEDILVKKLLSANIYIMASHIENSPNNLCEAMILGLPCIATDVGGTSTLLTNKVEGILIQDGDSWSMAGSILELINDIDLVSKYSRNARVKALERHDPIKIINELLDIYGKLILEY